LQPDYPGLPFFSLPLFQRKEWVDFAAVVRAAHWGNEVPRSVLLERAVPELNAAICTGFQTQERRTQALTQRVNTVFTLRVTTVLFFQSMLGLVPLLDGFTAIGNDGDEHQLIYYLRKKSSVVARAVEPSLPLSCAGIKIQMAVTMHHCYAAATQTLIHKHWIKAGFC
jgi:hypothetical protein